MLSRSKNADVNPTQIHSGLVISTKMTSSKRRDSRLKRNITAFRKARKRISNSNRRDCCYIALLSEWLNLLPESHLNLHGSQRRRLVCSRHSCESNVARRYAPAPSSILQRRGWRKEFLGASRITGHSGNRTRFRVNNERR